MLGGAGEKVCKSLITQGLFRPQQPYAPRAVETPWGPPHADCARHRDPAMGVVLPVVGDVAVPRTRWQRQLGSAGAWHAVHGGQAVLCGFLSPKV